MDRPQHHALSRRERQIMDLLYRGQEMTAGEIHREMPEPPSYSAVRAMLRVLEEKGHIRHQEKNLRYVYSPVVPVENAKRSALRHLLDTFFAGSPEQAVAALLDGAAGEISDSELDRMASLIAQARREEGRKENHNGSAAGRKEKRS
jgi:predicted transcriptional regulator